MKKLFCFRYFLAIVLILACFSISLPVDAYDTPAFYYRIDIDAPINPVISGYLSRTIDQAEADAATALVVRLNTPGGLMPSMEEMTTAIMQAEVPVIVWVGPTGARSASAGVFISYAAHVSAMSEGTRIGAAHPVLGGGQEMDETMKDKVVSDALAQLRVMANRRDRSETVAERFVRESLSLTASEALEQKAIDFISPSIEELLVALEGREVVLDDERIVILPGLLEIREIPTTWKEDFLNILINPNLVYLLMALGMWALIYEFSNPGLGLGAAVGGTCLLLALYGLSVLPISYAGLGLLLLGLTLMILDLFVPSYGVLSLGGLTSFVLGSVMLFETDAFSVSYGLIIGIAGATLAFIITAGYLVFSNWDRPIATGEESLAGSRGIVKKTLAPEGMVHVRGELWQAVSEGGTTIEQGDEVEVLSRERTKLTVTRPE